LKSPISMLSRPLELASSFRLFLNVDASNNFMDAGVCLPLRNLKVTPISIKLDVSCQRECLSVNQIPILFRHINERTRFLLAPGIFLRGIIRACCGGWC